MTVMEVRSDGDDPKPLSSDQLRDARRWRTTASHAWVTCTPGDLPFEVSGIVHGAKPSTVPGPGESDSLAFQAFHLELHEFRFVSSGSTKQYSNFSPMILG